MEKNKPVIYKFKRPDPRPCPVEECPDWAPAGELLCKEHWLLLPLENRKAIVRARNKWLVSRPTNLEAQKEHGRVCHAALLALDALLPASPEEVQGSGDRV